MNILDLLALGELEAIALAAPAQDSLSYRALNDHLDAAVRALGALGIGRGDRVALVLPNGPSLAVAFLAAAAAAVAAPLNPAYRAEEFDFYLRDLQIRALIAPAGSASPAVTVAREQGIAVIELVEEPGGAAGAFLLRGEGKDPVAASRAQASDVALLLPPGRPPGPRLCP